MLLDIRGKEGGVAMYVVSALWRQSHPWLLFGGLLGVVGGIEVVNLTAGLLVALVAIGCVSWELVARTVMVRRGRRVLYVLRSPAGWVRRRLRQLGYTGPVARRIWEMHVDEDVRWPEGVASFRAAYTADRLWWLAHRPPNVGLIICTFNRLPDAEMAALEAAGAWVTAGPLHPRIPRVVSKRRMRKTQQRMFGAVVSPRDRTDGRTWTTVYVPPRGRA